MAVTNTFTTFQMTYVGEPQNYSDYDNLNISNPTLIFCPDDEQTMGAASQPVFYSLIFLLGVLGNGLVVTVLLRSRRFLRITEIYLLHLAIADLMLLLTFPFHVVDHFTGWLFGEFLCKLLGLIKNMNVLCGSFLLACIGFDRYLAIVHAVPSMRHRRPRTVHTTCIILWLVCFGLSIPSVVFLAVTEGRNKIRLSCDIHDTHGHNWVLTNRVLNHVCFFFPLGIMVYCYTLVVVTLCKSQKPQTKQGAIRLALLITLVFCICWLPHNVTIFIQTMVDLDIIKYDSCTNFELLHSALEATSTLGLTHSCLNPFLYAFVGVQFRKELYKLLCQISGSSVRRSVNHNRSFSSEGPTVTSII